MVTIPETTAINAIAMGVAILADFVLYFLSPISQLYINRTLSIKCHQTNAIFETLCRVPRLAVSAQSRLAKSRTLCFTP